MPKEQNTISNEYLRYCQAVYQGQEHLMPAHQKLQIKQAFYAGAQVMFALINQAADFDERQGAEYAQRLHEELEGFFRMQRELFEGKTVRINL